MLIVGGEAFACMRVKTAGSMPYFRVLFGRQEAFPFYSVQVQYLGENLVQILSSNISEGDVLVYQTKSGMSSMMRMMGGGPR